MKTQYMILFLGLAVGLSYILYDMFFKSKIGYITHGDETKGFTSKKGLNSGERKGVEMETEGELLFYGSHGCSWCVKQLDLIKRENIDVKFVNCDKQQCPSYIKGYPHWKRGNKDVPGFLTKEQIARHFYN